MGAEVGAEVILWCIKGEFPALPEEVSGEPVPRLRRSSMNTETLQCRTFGAPIWIIH